MTSGTPAIENLVFEGGGVRGIAYAGALKVLEDRGLFPNVQRVAGTSAGAFAALVVALGGCSDDLRAVLQAFPFQSLEDKPNPIRVATHYGLYKGEVLLDWITMQLTNKGLAPDLTFREMHRLGMRDLRVFATDLNRCNTREFSAHETPDASVAGAVRASMSIPLMYAAWQFPDGVPDDHIYVDGGAVYNYPINAFDGVPGGLEKTLGFCFVGDHAEPAFAGLGLDNLLGYGQSLLAAILSAQRIDFHRDLAEVKRSVRIDDLGFRATDLSLSEDAFDQLYRSGLEAATLHLDRM